MMSGRGVMFIKWQSLISFMGRLRFRATYESRHGPPNCSGGLRFSFDLSIMTSHASAACSGATCDSERNSRPCHYAMFLNQFFARVKYRYAPPGPKRTAGALRVRKIAPMLGPSAPKITFRSLVDGKKRERLNAVSATTARPLPVQSEFFIR